MTIILNGPVPSKKNSKQIVSHATRQFIVPSNDFAAWHAQQMYKLKEMKRKIYAAGVSLPITRATMAINFFFKDRRRKDLTNGADSIMDLLVDAGILKDDCWTLISDIELHGALDKEKPRSEIIIVPA